MRIAALAVCLVVAVIPLLLLNGQTFTNTLISLSAFAASLGVCVVSALRHQLSRAAKREWAVGAALIGVVMIAVGAKLPSDYRHQRQFNENAQQARSASLSAAR